MCLAVRLRSFCANVTIRSSRGRRSHAINCKAESCPQIALLEGQAKGMNIVNLLAAKWGEMFSNLGNRSGEISVLTVRDQQILTL